MERVANGEQKASRELLDRVLERVRKTVRYGAYNQSEADDIVQTVLLELLRSARTFKGQSSLETWCDRVATYVTVQYTSKRRRADTTTVPTAELPEVGLEQPRDEREAHLLRKSLAVMLETLPPERRTALILRYVHGHSVPEIAALTDTPLNTVRDRLRVGLKELREAWGDDAVLREVGGS